MSLALEQLAAKKVAELPSRTTGSGHFFSPTWDALMVGGASILLFGAFMFLMDKGASVNQISWVAFYLGFLVNWPHFLISYQFLYSDHREKIFKNPAYLWAGVVVPLLLAQILIVGVWRAPQVLGYAVQAMYFLVGWHYVKQTYGIVIVTSVINRTFYTEIEKRLLRLNLYGIWLISFAAQNSGAQGQLFYGMKYDTFSFPPMILRWGYVWLAVSGILLIAALLKKYIEDGSVPPRSSWIAFAATYLWLLPTFYHPGFFYMVPFFHSLQYLLFATALKKGKVQAELAHVSGKEFRRKYLEQFFGYLLTSVAMGALAFHIVPSFLDARIKPAGPELSGAEIFLVLANLFINIHHYFIDNIIWRRTNPELRDYLIRPNQKPA